MADTEGMADTERKAETEGREDRADREDRKQQRHGNFLRSDHGRHHCRGGEAFLPQYHLNGVFLSEPGGKVRVHYWCAAALSRTKNLFMLEWAITTGLKFFGKFRSQLAARLKGANEFKEQDGVNDKRIARVCFSRTAAPHL
jgi:hypothetical protein